jgi:hypothetical protein
MNPIFSMHGEGWPGYPKRSFARLDQTEPIVAGQNTEMVFSLDAVDAAWFGFAPGGHADLLDVDGILRRQQLFWSDRFAYKTPGEQDPYDEMPIYRIEITVRPGDPYYAELVTLTEDEWVAISLTDPVGGQEVDVFGALLAAAPVIAQLERIEKNIMQRAALNAAFSMDTWPDASEAEIRNALSSLGPFQSLVGLDVGQGTAIGLTDTHNDIRLYFDLGGGVYRNAPTRPNPLRFCWVVADAPIVLSHWDSDHWAGEITDPPAGTKTWIAPRQKITTKHIAFANRILAAGGKLLIWGSTPTSISLSLAGAQTLELSRCTGTSRNGSGIAAVVRDSALGSQWLLMGDAGYHELRAMPTAPSVVVVPHHGADMGSKSVPPASPGGYVRLIYSFGPGNRHGRSPLQHPTPSAVRAHSAWNHGTWVGATPGASVAGGDVLATAEHPSSHLTGVAVGWKAAPPIPFGSFPHASAGGSTGCTGRVNQA